jgi:uncharacterized protein with PQ loop repeat
MPKRHHKSLERPMSLDRKVINRIIIPVAVIQPLATIPQIVTVFSHHDGTSLSIWSWLIYSVFDALWLWYGISERQKAIIVSGLLFTVLEGAVFVGALLYGGKW